MPYTDGFCVSCAGLPRWALFETDGAVLQVKVRGYSVVLGAVEAALAEHEKVASSVVVAEGEEGSDEKRLVAFVVPLEWRRPPSAAAIRTFLKTKLPVYAVPSVFIGLEALPVSATAAVGHRPSLQQHLPLAWESCQSVC